MNFAVPNYVLKGYPGGWSWPSGWWGFGWPTWNPGADPQTRFYYDLPDSILVNADMMNKSFAIKNSNGKKVGTFKILARDDGSLYLDIVFDDSYLDTISAGNARPGTPPQFANYSQGSLYFECEIDKSGVSDNGDVNLEFTGDDSLEIPAKDVEFPDGESFHYNLQTEKSGSFQKEGNKLVYTVKVHSTKGTPKEINLTDVLTMTGDNMSVNDVKVVSTKKYSETPNGWGGWNTVSGTESTLDNPNISSQSSGNTTTMTTTLPKLDAAPANTRTTYEITYEVELNDAANMEFSSQFQNKVTADSTSDGGEKVENDANSNPINVTKTMLSKSGSYSQDQDQASWEIQLNPNNQDIKDKTLKDDMFQYADQILINGKVAEDCDEYTVVKDKKGQITGIQFKADADGKNQNKYVITYTTPVSALPAGSIDANNKVTNTAEFEDLKKPSSVEVQRNYHPKKATGNAAFDEDSGKLTVDWIVSFYVPSSGLSDDLAVSDTTNYNPDSNAPHSMTLDQVKAVYNAVKDTDWFQAAGKDFTVATPDGSVAIADVLANEAAYADTVFTGYHFGVDKTKVPAQYNGKEISFSYSTTADVSSVAEGKSATVQNTFDIGAGVGPTTSASYDYHKDKPVVPVKKLNANWGEDDNYQVNNKTGEITWHVQINQTKNGTLTITDTLPPEVELVRVEMGEWMQTKVTPEMDDNGDFKGTLTAAMNSWGDARFMTIDGTYTADDNGDAFTINVVPVEGTEGQSSVLGAGKRMEMKIVCKLKDAYMPTVEEGQKTYTLTNKIDVEIDNQEYGKDDNTQKLTVTSEPPLTKTFLGGDKTTGELQWKVEVYQGATYANVKVQDNLPTVVGLQSVTVGAGSVLTHDPDVLPDGNGDVPLTLTTQAAGDAGLNITGTYNTTTNIVTVVVKENDGATVNSAQWGEDKKFPLIYNCKIKDEYMPDTTKGEYEKPFNGLKNDAKVWKDDEPEEYGIATTTSNWEVTLERPYVEPGTKTHVWSDALQELQYTVDINPGAADLDPSKNMIDVSDTVSYNHNDGSYDRKLTLVKESVKLYYADYDEYGNPKKEMRDEQERLVIGQEVAYTDWTMTHYENFKDDSWSVSTSTMDLTVPDGRALILVYTYFVEMNEVEGWDNKINVSNTFTVNKGLSSTELRHQTGDKDVFKVYDAGGHIHAADTYTITKVDSLNHALVLPGAVFEVDEYQSTDDETGEQTWKTVATYYTDASGMLTVMYDPEADTNMYNYKANRAYRIHEVQAPYGYELPPLDTYSYFYWSDDHPDVDKRAPEVMPEMFTGQAIDLTGQPYTTLVENTKCNTNLEAHKVWKNPDGTLLDDSEVPPSVTVHLRRYAIPQSVWEANENRYNGGLPNEKAKVTVTLMDHSENFNVSFTREVVIGAMLKFDITVNDKNIGHTPQFQKLPADHIMTMEIEGNAKVYHFQVPIQSSDVKDGAIKFVGHFQDNQWWGWTGELSPTVRFTNVSAAFDSEFNDAPLKTELEQYIDRSFNSTMKLTSAGNWTGSWENLDVVGKDDNENPVHYKYFVVEESPSGFASTVTGGSNDLNGEYVITNVKDNSVTTTTSLRVVKEWYGENGLKAEPLEDAIEVRIYQKNELTGEEHVYPYNGFPITVINANTNWQFFFADLPRQTTDAEGNLVESFTYRVEEVTKGDFTTELVVTDNSGIVTRAIDAADAQVIIKNTRKHPVDITVKKAWSGVEGTEDKVVVVELSRNRLTEDGYVKDESFSEADTMGLPLEQELHAANGWSYTWLDLPDSGWEPKLDSLGQPVIDPDTGDPVLESVSYQYVVTEIGVCTMDPETGDVSERQTPEEAGYHVAYSTNKGAVPNDGSMTITNSMPARMDITKAWFSDDEATQPADPAVDAVYIKLYKDDADITSTLTKATNNVTPFNGYIKVGKDEGWKVSLIGLEDGTYTLKEFLYDQATATYQVQTVGNGTLLSITNPTEDTGAGQDFLVKNKVASTKLVVKKTWTPLENDANVSALRATFQLMRHSSDGSEDEEYGDPFTLHGNENHEIEDLPTANEDGSVTYTYYVKETDEPNGFTAVYSNSADGKNFIGVPSNGMITVENRQNKTAVTVRKSWQDASGGAITAPSGVQISVALYRKGTTTAEEKVGGNITLPNNGSWSYTVNNLPTHSVDGTQAYTYYFKELPGEGTNDLTGKFTKWYVVQDDNGTSVEQEATTAGSAAVINGNASIINRAMDTSVYVSKAWKDADGKEILGNNETLPANVTFQLYQRVKKSDAQGAANTDPGTVYFTFTLPERVTETALPTWNRVIEDLPLTGVDDSGNIVEYEYTVKEVAVEGFQTTNPTIWVNSIPADSDDHSKELTVTNTMTSLKLNVKKVWENVTESDVQNVQLNVLRYIVDGAGNKVVDGRYCEELALNGFAADANGTSWSRSVELTNLPSHGVITDTVQLDADGNYKLNAETGKYDSTQLAAPLKGKFHYFIIEPYADLRGDEYEVTYKLEGQNASSELPIGASTDKDGTLMVTNRKRMKLEVKKEWDSSVAEYEKQEIEFTLWRKETDAALTKAAKEASETVKVILKIKPKAADDPNDPNGELTKNVEVDVPVGSTITWKPRWNGNGDVNNDPASSNNYGVKSAQNHSASAVVNKNQGDDIWEFVVEAGPITKSDNIALLVSNWFYSQSVQQSPYKGDWENLDSVTTHVSGGGGSTPEPDPGTYIGTGYLNAENNWQTEFYDLPTQSADGTKLYQYFVTEETEGYDVTYTNNDGVTSGTITITNTKPEQAPTTYTVKLQKQWLGYNAEGVMSQQIPQNASATFQLWQQYTDAAGNTQDSEVSGKTITLPQNGLWTYDFTDLPQTTNVNGNTYALRYYVKETEHKPSYYVTEYSNDATNPVTNGTITVVNAQPMTQIKVEKYWVDTNGNAITPPKGATVTLALWQTIEGQTETTTKYGADIVLSAENNWATTVDNLPLNPPAENAAATDDTEYLYYIVEKEATSTDVNGNSVLWTGTVSNGTPESGVNTSTTPITVYNQPPVTSLTLNKLWLRYDGTTPVDEAFLNERGETLPEQIEVNLYYRTKRPWKEGDDAALKEGDVVYGEKTLYRVVSLSKEQSWTTQLTDLPKYMTDTAGNLCEVEYIVEEVTELDNYTPQNPTNYAPNDGNGTLEVKNIHKAELKVNKQWFKEDGTQDTDLSDKEEIRFSLYRTAVDPTGTAQAMQKNYSSSKRTNISTQEKNGQGVHLQIWLHSANTDYSTGNNEFWNTREAKTGDIVEVTLTRIDSAELTETENSIKSIINSSGNNAEISLEEAKYTKKTEGTSTIHKFYLTMEKGWESITVKLGYAGNDREKWTCSLKVVGTAPKTAKVPIYFIGPEGQFGTGDIELESSATSYTVTPESAGIAIPENYELDTERGPATVEVMVMEGVAEPATVTFYYKEKVTAPTPTPTPPDGAGIVTPSPTPTLPPDVVVTPVPVPEPEVGAKVAYNGQTEFVLNNGNDWQMVFDDLPATDSSGRTYSYFVVEAPVDGYTATYDPSTGGPDGTLTIKNTKDKEPVPVYLQVKKVWAGDDGDTSGRKDVTFQLWRREVRADEEQTPTQPTYNISTTGLTAVTKPLIQNATYRMVLSTYANNNANGFADTAEVTYNGKTYTLTRDSSGSLPVKYSMVFKASAAGTIELPETTELLTGRTDAASVEWSVNFIVTDLAETLKTASRAFTVQSRASEAVDTAGATLLYDGLTLNASNQWTFVFKDLPAKSADGKYRYEYFVVETDVPQGYEVSYSANNSGANNNELLEITNTKIKQTFLNLTVKKEWKALAGETIPDSAYATFKLWQIGSDGTETVCLVNGAETFTISKNSPSLSISDLPGANDDNTVTYTYRVEEVSSFPDNSKAYKVSYDPAQPLGATLGSTESKEVTVTNAQKTTVLSVEKLWQNPDGSSLQPPTNVRVTVKVRRRCGRIGSDWKDYPVTPEIVLSTEKGWSRTLSGLPAVDPATGKNYYYKISEAKIETLVNGEWQDLPLNGFTSDTPENGATGGRLAITNTVQTLNIQVSKQWFNPNGGILSGDTAFLPDQINFILLQSEVPASGKEPVWTQYGYEPYSLTKANGWQMAFTDLPRYTIDSTTGELIAYQYRVQEITVDGFTTNYVNNEGVSVDNGQITIRNTLPATSYKVTKTWNGSLPTRPAVTIELMQTISDGTRTYTEKVEDIILSGENWSHQWDDLPTMGSITRTVNGAEVTVSGKITYSVREVEPAGYISTSGTSDLTNANGDVIGRQTNISNTPTELTVSKFWKDLATGAEAVGAAKDIRYQIMQQKVRLDGTLEGAPQVYMQTTYLNGTATAAPDNGIYTLSSDATATHYTLPIYWVETVDGAATKKGTYRYSIVEVDEAGNEITSAQYSDANVTVERKQDITITNTVTNISVRKWWSDANGNTFNMTDPNAQATLILKRRTGNMLDPNAEKDPNFSMKYTLKAADGWFYTWRNLETYGVLNGEQVQWYYYVEEQEGSLQPGGYHHNAAVDRNNIGITGEVKDQIIEITNATTLYELPETGGIGTTPYTLGGLMMVLISMTALLYNFTQGKKSRGEGRMN